MSRGNALGTASRNKPGMTGPSRTAYATPPDHVSPGQGCFGWWWQVVDSNHRRRTDGCTDICHMHPDLPLCSALLNFSGHSPSGTLRTPSFAGLRHPCSASHPRCPQTGWPARLPNAIVSNQNRPICSTRTLTQNPPAGRPHIPGAVIAMQVLQRDRLGGLLREYAQVA
jgi:hypothetical protein